MLPTFVTGCFNAAHLSSVVKFEQLSAGICTIAIVHIFCIVAKYQKDQCDGKFKSTFKLTINLQ